MLTTFHGGRWSPLAIVGRDSRCVLVFPVVRWALMHLRPDLTVHCVVEDAGSMGSVQQGYMIDLLGISLAQVARVDTAVSSAF